MNFTHSQSVNSQLYYNIYYMLCYAYSTRTRYIFMFSVLFTICNHCQKVEFKLNVTRAHNMNIEHFCHPSENRIISTLYLSHRYATISFSSTFAMVAFIPWKLCYRIESDICVYSVFWVWFIDTVLWIFDSFEIVVGISGFRVLHQKRKGCSWTKILLIIVLNCVSYFMKSEKNTKKLNESISFA